MAYPFVRSYFDFGARGIGVPMLATVIHMAEGGGTVGYLSRDNPNGVAVHYVIEYSGRIVQMLAESRVNGSINPRDIRTTDDPPYTYQGETIRYGATAAKAVLGEYHRDPNRATIGIEIEGFARNGPNQEQKPALLELIEDIRKRHPNSGLLGHRDFADYKACPGKLIDWHMLGGHGPASQQEDPTVKFRFLGPADGTVIVGVGRGLVNVETGATVVPSKTATTSLRAFARLGLAQPLGEQEAEERQKGYGVNFDKWAYLALDDVVEDYQPADTGTSPGPHSHTVVTTVDGQKVEGTVTLP